VVCEHDPLGRDVELFHRNLYTAGKVGSTVKGSEGAELVDRIVIREEDFKLVKTRFSAFFSTHLHYVLQREGINSLVITGVQTPNCIWQTFFNDVSLDYQHVTVLFDATTATTPDIHLVNMEELLKIYKPNIYGSKQSSLGMELVREMDGDSNMGSRKHYYES
ncbi:hypothetical protein RYX36_010231, partial [Vicia faba]